MNPLMRAEISFVKKSKWLKVYIRAREKIFIIRNMLGWWRDAGLFPLNPKKVLRHLPSNSSSQSSSISSIMSITSNISDISLITNSLSDAIILQSANITLNEIIDTETSLETPQWNYIRRLIKIIEYLRISVFILKRENKELKIIIQARREHKKDKQFILKDQLILTKSKFLNIINIIDKKKENQKKIGLENVNYQFLDRN